MEIYGTDLKIIFEELQSNIITEQYKRGANFNSRLLTYFL